MCKITVVRHGSTDLNESDALRGWLNVPLSELGKEQAVKVSNHLATTDKENKFDFIYTSDLSRAVDTANAIAKWHIGIPAQWTTALRPINFGILQGLPYPSIKKQLADLWAAWEGDLAAEAPGGESFAAFQNRIFPFYESLTKDKNAIILLVTHTRCASYLMAVALNDGQPLTTSTIWKMKELETGCGNLARIEDGEITQLNPVKQITDGKKKHAGGLS